MPPRRRQADAPTGPLTAWGTLDWSHAPVARQGYAGPCYRCGRPALLRHPVTGAPCHKVCEDKHPTQQPPLH